MAQTTATAPVLKLLTIQDIENCKETEYLVEELLPAKSLCVLWGKPGVGKSFLALDVAFHVATGQSWQSRRVMEGSVVYIASEGAAGVLKRWNAWKKQHGDQEAVHFGLAPQPLNLLAAKKDALERLALQLSEIEPKVVLIVVDTLARSMVGGDENSSKDMGVVISRLDHIRNELECAVLLVHHADKNGRSLRGSTALPGAADTIISVRRDSGGKLQLKCDKQKDSDPFRDIAVQLERIELGDGQSSLVVVAGSGEPDCHRPGESAQAVLNALTSASQATSSGDLQEASDLKPRTFHRVIRDLVEQGRVVEERVGRQKLYSLATAANCQTTAK